MSWLGTATKRIRDDGADEVLDTEAQALLLKLLQDLPAEAPELARRLLVEDIDATATPARDPWPPDVFVVIKSLMKGEDNDTLNKTVNKARYRVTQAGPELTGDYSPFYSLIVNVAISLRGLVEPVDPATGKPIHQDDEGRGIWEDDKGKTPDPSRMSLEERIKLVGTFPAGVVRWVSEEIDRTNRNPFATPASEPVTKTSSEPISISASDRPKTKTAP